MSTAVESAIELRYTAEFKRNLRALSKKYRHIRSDIQPVIDAIQVGNFPGDQVPGVGYTIYKVRVQNRDLQKGKRSGYRLIYYLQTPKQVILITVYSKTEQADISAVQLRHILSKLDSEP
ncbi:MAG: type II toxin-antitoxin system RelE/ParE family toxin [Anaerolineae bacterium]|nr:type II toxin-antitoxin system RelE/ParE family toxin [Anaerolineae bacterium]